MCPNREQSTHFLNAAISSAINKPPSSTIAVGRITGYIGVFRKQPQHHLWMIRMATHDHRLFKNKNLLGLVI
jgi:hypothetical protein